MVPVECALHDFHVSRLRKQRRPTAKVTKCPLRNDRASPRRQARMFGGYARAGGLGHEFSKKYRCYSVALAPTQQKRDDVEFGGKSALIVCL